MYRKRRSCRVYCLERPVILTELSINFDWNANSQKINEKYLQFIQIEKLRKRFFVLASQRNFHDIRPDSQMDMIIFETDDLIDGYDKRFVNADKFMGREFIQHILHRAFRYIILTFGVDFYIVFQPFDVNNVFDEYFDGTVLDFDHQVAG